MGGSSHSLSSPIHHPPKFSMSIMGCWGEGLGGLDQRRGRFETYGPKRATTETQKVKDVSRKNSEEKAFKP